MTMLNVGQSAPDISGMDIIGGGQFSLSNYRGKVVCLAFVLYHCSKCGNELKALQNLWTKYRDLGVQMAASLITNNSTPDMERTWLAGLTAGGITFPVIRDTDCKNVVKYNGYGIFPVPMLFIIDGKQVISHTNSLQAEEESISDGHILEAICGCCSTLPQPQIDLKPKKENYKTKDGEFTRYRLTVVNRDAYPADLFQPAPCLPPCGLNKNSSRSWVDIYDEKNKRIYGFCAFTTPADLDRIWFAVPLGHAPPNKVYIKITDRLCNKIYTSNQITIA
jgi:peroxiredoxin